MPYPDKQGGGKKAYKEIMGIREATKEGGKSFWSRIGVAFENQDGSWQLRFDYFPTDIKTTNIQMRDPRPRDSKPGAPASDRDIDF